MDLRFLNSERRSPALPGRAAIIVFLSLLLIPFVINQTNAQVRIKEKVEIAPHDIIFSEEQAENALLRLEIIVDGIIGKPYYGVSTYWENYSGVGNFSMEKLNPTGPVNFGVTFMTDSGHIGYGTYMIRAYFGGYLIDSSSGVASEVWGAVGYTCLNPGYTFFRGVNVGIPAGSSECIIEGFFVAEAILDNNICEGGEAWEPTSVISFSISGNAEFLNTETKELLGTSISLPYSEYRSNTNKYVIMSKVPFYSQPETAELTASLRGSSSTTDIVLKPQSRFYLSDDLCATTVTDLHMVPYCDYSWQDYYLRWFTTEVRITSGGEYVSFYNNETGETAGDNLTLSPSDNVDVYNYSTEKYFLKIDNDEPPSDTIPVIVEYEVLGNVQADTVFIGPPGDPFIDAFVDSWTGNDFEHNENKDLILIMGRDGCYYPFPDTTSFIISTTYGAQYGEIVDDYGSGISGDELDISIRDGCCLMLVYKANGEMPEDGDSVVIKIESSIPGIEPEYITLFVNPQMIRLTIKPDVLLPGDTADVIIEKWNIETHIYKPLEAEEWFEVGMEEGCADGILLLSDGIKGGFFTEISGVTVKFIAADSLEGDSAVVKIRAGIWGGMASIVVTGNDVKDNIKDKVDNETKRKNELFVRIDELNIPENTKDRLKQKLNGLNKLTPSGSAEAVCPINNYSADLNDKKELSVKKKCSNLEKCSEHLSPEFIQIQHKENGFPNINICETNVEDPITHKITAQTGGFFGQWWRTETLQKITATPCFNSEKNRVNFSMCLTDTKTNQKSIILKPEAIFDICEGNIRSAGWILITSLEDMLFIMKSFPDQIPILKQDMDSSISRYNATIIKYKFLQEIITHETEHEKDYLKILYDLKNDLLDKNIASYSITCSTYSADPPWEIEIAKNKIVDILVEYIKKAVEKSGNADENEVQKRLVVETSLWEYYALYFKYQIGLIF